MTSTRRGIRAERGRRATAREPAQGPLRRLLPWLVAAGAAQAAMRVGGRLLARRLDSGDETSTSIRRVRTFDQLRLAPTSVSLSRLRLDLVFAGAQVDLTGAEPRPGGIDLTLSGAFAGGEVRVPEDWRVVWDKRGIGGVGGRGELRPGGPEADAELHIHLRALMAGVAVTR